MPAANAINAAVLYAYCNKYGTTREGAVLAADPYCTKASSVKLARLILVTDDGMGGADAVSALSFALEPGPLPQEHAAICNALLRGKYASAVQEAERLGILK